MKMITGLSAFPVTPMDGEGRVETGALQLLIERLVVAGVDSIGLLGSTGSYAYLSRRERQRAVRAVAECIAGRVPLLAGIGALRTDEAVMLARDALAAGARAGLLAPVSYAPLLDDEVFAHFVAVAEVGLPLCIYNNPATTHFTFSPELIGRLAALPNVVAVKTGAPPANEAGTVLADLRSRVPEAFSVGFSADWNAAGALIAGGDAWYSVLAGLFPATCLRLTRAAQAVGQAEEARRLNHRLEPVWHLFKTYSSYRVVHCAAALAGIPHVRLPPPVLPLTGEAAREVERVFGALSLD